MGYFRYLKQQDKQGKTQKEVLTYILGKKEQLDLKKMKLMEEKVKEGDPLFLRPQLTYKDKKQEKPLFITYDLSKVRSIRSVLLSKQWDSIQIKNLIKSMIRSLYTLQQKGKGSVVTPFMKMDLDFFFIPTSKLLYEENLFEGVKTVFIITDTLPQDKGVLDGIFIPMLDILEKRSYDSKSDKYINELKSIINGEYKNSLHSNELIVLWKWVLKKEESQLKGKQPPLPTSPNQLELGKDEVKIPDSKEVEVVEVPSLIQKPIEKVVEQVIEETSMEDLYEDIEIELESKTTIQLVEEDLRDSIELGNLDENATILEINNQPTWQLKEMQMEIYRETKDGKKVQYWSSDYKLGELQRPIRQELGIGRHSTSDIRVQESIISRKHSVMLLDQSLLGEGLLRVEIRDNQSSNGTRVGMVEVNNTFRTYEDLKNSEFIEVDSKVGQSYTLHLTDTQTKVTIGLMLGTCYVRLEMEYGR